MFPKSSGTRYFGNEVEVTPNNNANNVGNNNLFKKDDKKDWCMVHKYDNDNNDKGEN
jgi:hypothetical protein